MIEGKPLFDVSFHKQTYQIIEIDFFNGVKRQLPEYIKLRDIYLIQTINRLKQKNQNSMTKIADAVLMSPSQFSNNIDFLSKKGVLYRVHNSDDRRIINLELTEKGQGFYNITQKLIVKTLKYTVMKLGIIKALKLYNLVHKITKNKQTKSKSINLKKFADNLISLYFMIINVEDDLLKNKNFHITNHDLKILTYTYLLEDDEVTILRLSELFEEPFTTIASAVQTMSNKQLIVKTISKKDHRKKSLSLTKTGQDIVNDHLALRRIEFERIVCALDDKNQAFVYEAYKHIKTYLSKIQ